MGGMDSNIERSGGDTKHEETERLIANESSTDSSCRVNGLASVTGSAIMFGCVAVLVKLAKMPTLPMLQMRAIVQWVVSLVVLTIIRRGDSSSGWMALLFGTTQESPWLLLRALVYWTFMLLWWTALSYMPVGDATTLVYIGPVFTSFFGWLILGETIRFTTFLCLALALAGVALVTQPEFLFGASGSDGKGANYVDGACLALSAAVLAGLLPSLVRLSKECHWASVEHCTALLSGILFTPAAFGVSMLVNHFSSSDVINMSWHASRGTYALVLAVAVVEFIALGLQTYGYQHEEVSKAGIMTFLEVPFAYLLQYLVFDDRFNGFNIVGVVLILICGLVTICTYGDEGDDAPTSGSEADNLISDSPIRKPDSDFADNGLRPLQNNCDKQL